MVDSTQGLRGTDAGSTAICTVGHTGDSLYYRGYSVADLSEHCCFEEVAYLLIQGKLPTQTELDGYKQKLVSLRSLPDSLKSVLKLIPKEAHPMDVLRTACSYLGTIEPEQTDFIDQQDKADRLLSIFPVCLNYWYNYSHNGIEIGDQSPYDSIAGHFLYTLHQRDISELEIKTVDVSLILYAEHEFNASTFNARVCAATLSDFFSTITGAIGTLRGPLHGGANEAAMALLETFDSVEDARSSILEKLSKKEKIMGFGHAVYKTKDPRNQIVKSVSEKLSRGHQREKLYPISCEVERVMKEEKGMFANADFFHASAYNFLDIPTKLFTPIFVISRTSGWTAHVFEQRANNKLIRPSAQYIGNPPLEFVAISDRS